MSNGHDCLYSEVISNCAKRVQNMNYRLQNCVFHSVMKAVSLRCNCSSCTFHNGICPETTLPCLRVNKLTLLQVIIFRWNENGMAVGAVTQFARTKNSHSELKITHSFSSEIKPRAGCQTNLIKCLQMCDEAQTKNPIALLFWQYLFWAADGRHAKILLKWSHVFAVPIASAIFTVVIKEMRGAMDFYHAAARDSPKCCV